MSGLRRFGQDFVFVEVVTLEEFLHAVPSQLGLAFFHLFCVLPLLVVYVVSVEVVHIDVRHILTLLFT